MLHNCGLEILAVITCAFLFELLVRPDTSRMEILPGFIYR